MKQLIIVYGLLFTVLGCDYVDSRVTEGERSDRLYQEAMAEYTAGRLDKSIAIFEKVLKASPGNASARFQLACLLQDHRKDMLGAICNYREYVALFPSGDKVSIANERAAVCERKLAEQLEKKFNLGGMAAQNEAIAHLKDDNAKLTTELEATKKELDKTRGDLAALRRENERVRRMVLSAASDDAASDESGVKSDELRTVSSESEVANGKRSPALPSEDELTKGDDEDVVDRVKFSADVANLIAEEKDETSGKAPFGNTVRAQTPEPPTAAETTPTHEKRPETYVVQEGDTLRKIALRFYGQRSAWERIRDANKATVSTDGRIKAGQTLKLP